MKPFLILLIAMMLCPVASATCDLCSKLESSTCTDPDLCYPDDYYRQLDKEITYYFTAGPGVTWNLCQS